MILQNISIIPVLNYYLQAINTIFTKKINSIITCNPALHSTYTQYV